MRKLLILVLFVFVFCTNSFALQKNIASQKWIVFAFDRTTNAAKTGDAANITGTLYIDGSSNTVDDTNPAELGHGYYAFDLAQAETNGDNIIMDVVSSTSNIQVIGCPGAVWTTIAQSGDSYARLGAPAGASVSADIAGVKTDTGNIYTDTHTTILGRLLGTIAAGTHNPQSGDAYAIVNNGTYGNSALNTLLTSTGIKVATNADKTGYALTQTFPTNFANLSISATTGLVDITQTAADKVWSTTARVLTAATNLPFITVANIWDADISGYSGTKAGTYLKGLYDKRPATGSMLDDTTWTGTKAGYIDAAVSSRSSHSAADVWAVATRVLTAGTNIVLAKGSGITGFNDITAQNVWEYVTRALTDKSGFALTQAFPTNFSSLAISALGKVTVGTNDDKTGYTASTVSDKTGYSLTQTFPTNFSTLAITAGGAVTAGTVSDKAGYTISGTKTTLDSLNDITAASVWGVATRTLTAGAYSGLTEADVDAIWNELQAGHTTTGSFGKYLDSQVSLVGGGSLTVEDIVNGVWDELLAGHQTAGSTGKKLNESPNPYNVGP